MSVLKQRIGERLSKLGLNQSELARRAGVSPSFVTDIMTERKKSIRSEPLFRIAAALEVEPSYLTVASRLGRLPRSGPEADMPFDDADLASVPPPVKLLAPFITADQEADWGAYLENDAYLPVFAALVKSENLIVIQQPHARVRRPPQLADVRGSYAVRVPNDDLSPRYLKGELIYAQPERSLIGARWIVAVRTLPAGGRLELQRARGFTEIGIHLAAGERQSSSLVPYTDLIALHRIVLAGDDVAA
ncbi:helix-turn-helix domain-containing protein [Methylobacterium sp. WL9]|uniref:helix-turn-helix domain-containing protein n=1 Tax=Methylobacterium sp. WL9 TaxID=2603898 RepID=UPI0016502B31|nr:helix-turn-helix domain-containing protein [Methylobacterium sp. WL9]